MINLLLIDDHVLMRSGFGRLLDLQADIKVVAQASNEQDALAMVRQHQPDVVVVKAFIPEMNVPDWTRRLLVLAPQTKVVAVSASSHDQSFKELFDAGAIAYVHKNDGFEHLLEAIRASVNDRAYVSPEIGGLFIQKTLGGGAGEGHQGVLSTREREILQLIAEGWTSAEIARMVHLSTKTVEFHRARIAKKLNISTIAGLTKYAIRAGLATLD